MLISSSVNDSDSSRNRSRNSTITTTTTTTNGLKGQLQFQQLVHMQLNRKNGRSQFGSESTGKDTSSDSFHTNHESFVQEARCNSISQSILTGGGAHDSDLQKVKFASKSSMIVREDGSEQSQSNTPMGKRSSKLSSMHSQSSMMLQSQSLSSGETKIIDPVKKQEDLNNVVKFLQSQKRTKFVAEFLLAQFSEFRFFKQIMQSLSEDLMQQIIFELRLEVLDKHEIIFNHNDVGGHMYFVLSGKVSILIPSKPQASSVSISSPTIDMPLNASPSPKQGNASIVEEDSIEQDDDDDDDDEEEVDSDDEGISKKKIEKNRVDNQKEPRNYQSNVSIEERVSGGRESPRKSDNLLQQKISIPRISQLQQQQQQQQQLGGGGDEKRKSIRGWSLSEEEEFEIFRRFRLPHFKQVNVVAEGNSFGEVALEQRIPRTASAATITKCYLATLSYDSFRKLLSKIYERIQLEQRSFLKQIPPFNDFPNQGIMIIYNNTEIITHSINNLVYKENEPSDYIYFIKEGEVEITKMFKIDQCNTQKLQTKNVMTQRMVIQNILQGRMFGEFECIEPYLKSKESDFSSNKRSQLSSNKKPIQSFRTTRVTCKTNVKLLRIAASQFFLNFLSFCEQRDYNFFIKQHEMLLEKISKIDKTIHSIEKKNHFSKQKTELKGLLQSPLKSHQDDGSHHQNIESNTSLPDPSITKIQTKSVVCEKGRGIRYEVKQALSPFLDDSNHVSSRLPEPNQFGIKWEKLKVEKRHVQKQQTVPHPLLQLGHQNPMEKLRVSLSDNEDSLDEDEEEDEGIFGENNPLQNFRKRNRSRKHHSLNNGSSYGQTAQQNQPVKQIQKQTNEALLEKTAIFRVTIEQLTKQRYSNSLRRQKERELKKLVQDPEKYIKEALAKSASESKTRSLSLIKDYIGISEKSTEQAGVATTTTTGKLQSTKVPIPEDMDESEITQPGNKNDINNPNNNNNSNLAKNKVGDIKKQQLKLLIRASQQKQVKNQQQPDTDSDSNSGSIQKPLSPSSSSFIAKSSQQVVSNSNNNNKSLFSQLLATRNLKRNQSNEIIIGEPLTSSQSQQYSSSEGGFTPSTQKHSLMQVRSHNNLFSNSSSNDLMATPTNSFHQIKSGVQTRMKGIGGVQGGNSSGGDSTPFYKFELVKQFGDAKYLQTSQLIHSARRLSPSKLNANRQMLAEDQPMANNSNLSLSNLNFSQQLKVQQQQMIIDSNGMSSTSTVFPQKTRLSSSLTPTNARYNQHVKHSAIDSNVSIHPWIKVTQFQQQSINGAAAVNSGSETERKKSQSSQQLRRIKSQSMHSQINTENNNAKNTVSVLFALNRTKKKEIKSLHEASQLPPTISAAAAVAATAASVATKAAISQQPSAATLRHARPVNSATTKQKSNSSVVSNLQSLLLFHQLPKQQSGGDQSSQKNLPNGILVGKKNVIYSNLTDRDVNKE